MDGGSQCQPDAPQLQSPVIDRGRERGRGRREKEGASIMPLNLPVTIPERGKQRAGDREGERRRIRRCENWPVPRSSETWSPMCLFSFFSFWWITCVKCVKGISIKLWLLAMFDLPGGLGYLPHLQDWPLLFLAPFEDACSPFVSSNVPYTPWRSRLVHPKVFYWTPSGGNMEIKGMWLLISHWKINTGQLTMPQVDMVWKEWCMLVTQEYQQDNNIMPLSLNRKRRGGIPHQD